MRSSQNLFGQRDYAWFGLLSGVRMNPLPGLGCLAQTGLPDNASAHTRTCFDDEDLHSHGWYSFADMMSWSHKIETQGRLRRDDKFSDAISLVANYLGLLESMLSGSGAHPVHIDNILVGPAFCNKTGDTLPAMAAESAHSRISRLHRVKRLCPIGPDTVRVVIAYDS